MHSIISMQSLLCHLIGMKLIFIPKKINASDDFEFRSIALYNIIYKFFTKVLASKSNLLLYLVEISIIKLLLLISWRTRCVHRKGKASLFSSSQILKRLMILYLQKLSCISSTLFSYLSNSLQSNQFNNKMGIRHGDLVSLYLFILVL